jgi:hypothetical protein
LYVSVWGLRVGRMFFASGCARAYICECMCLSRRVGVLFLVCVCVCVYVCVAIECLYSHGLQHHTSHY